ncbi:hypothetical protein Sjap_002256 [Stephania japonica]|uniref:Phosphatidylinositol N-acetylglucosaminyltransferase subunit Y n=1 Tax=Stephania japonica TaxID=461633 RepID=A0AAP0KLI8_9MAGN
MTSASSYTQSVSSRGNVFWAWSLIIIGFILFLSFFYTAILSKLLPKSENPNISAIQNDRYYCILVPVTLPVLVVAVYLHWLSMKLFKHA